MIRHGGKARAPLAAYALWLAAVALAQAGDVRILGMAESAIEPASDFEGARGKVVVLAPGADGLAAAIVAADATGR